MGGKPSPLIKEGFPSYQLEVRREMQVNMLLTYPAETEDTYAVPTDRYPLYEAKPGGLKENFDCIGGYHTCFVYQRI